MRTGSRTQTLLLPLVLVSVLAAPVALASGASRSPSAALLASTPVASPAAGAPLDLPAMVLVPADLPWPGYGRPHGGFEDVVEVADQLASGRPDAAPRGAAEIGEDLIQAGFVRRYRGMLAAPRADDPRFYAAQVWSVVTEFQSAEGATDGFAVLGDPDTLPPESTLLPDPPGIGDQAVLVQQRTELSDGTPFRALTVVFRDENLVLGAQLNYFSEHEPASADVETLGRTLLERVDSVRAGDAPGLSARVLRLTGEGTTTVDEGYVRLGGERIPGYEGADAADNAPWLGSAVDAYAAESFLAEEGEPRPYFYAGLLRQATAEDASETVRSLPDGLRSWVSGLLELSAREESIAGVDEALTVSYSFEVPASRRQALLIALRVEAEVAVILFSGGGPLGLGDVSDLVGAQARCLRSEACQPEPLPDRLMEAMAPSAEIVLEAYDIGWRTADQPGPQVTLTVAAGTTIALVNTGVAAHDFSVDELGIDVDMPVGFAGSVTIPQDAQPGTYDFTCDVPGHGVIMFGTITVDPDAGAGGQAVPTQTPP